MLPSKLKNTSKFGSLYLHGIVPCASAQIRLRQGIYRYILKLYMSLIERLATELNAAKVPFAIVGGVALALHGAPRGTVDVDVITEFSESNFIKFEECLARIGLVSRIPVSAAEVFRFREEYISRRNLVAWSFCNPRNPLEVVDLIITHDLKRARRERKRVGISTVYVISIPDLIKMKQLSNRPQDREDILVLRKLLT